jgi:hypothetical protein
MRLDLNDPLPSLETRRGKGMGSIDNKSKGYQLLAAVLDPTELATGAPVAGISLTGPKLELYKHILETFQGLSSQFYRDGGFIDEPETYTAEKQKDIFAVIDRMGRNIYDLFQTQKENAVRSWLAKLLNPYVSVRPMQPVTVITNDFSIPWFWLKTERAGPFLCEVCPLGMQELSAAIPAQWRQSRPGRGEKSYDALVLKGDSNLPFIEEELISLKRALTDPKHGEEGKDIQRLFNIKAAEKRDDLPSLNRRRQSTYRLIHFIGNYAGEELVLDGKPLHIDFIRQILNGSLVVLDGCSSVHEQDPWGDIMELSAVHTDAGALGCIMTALPVKHDPIISDILWGEFYGSLRRGGGVVGEALLNARLALKNHLQQTNSPNPAWATYQLIGSPTVQFSDGEEERPDEWN